MDYPDHVERLALADPVLAAEVRPLRGLEGVMGWMARWQIPLAAAEITPQDEYSLDFVVPLAEGGPFVAFGIT